MPENMLFSEDHRARISHRLNQALVNMRSGARRAAEARQAFLQLEQEKSQLIDRNPNLANVDVRRQTMFIWIVICILAAYGLDLILFAAVAGYLVQQNFSGSPHLALVAQFLVPAFIVILEMALSMQRDAAYRDYYEGFGTRLRTWFWTALTAFCTLVMPAAVIATFLAGQGEDFVPWVSIPLIIALAGLSLISHVLMLCGGRLALESKSWALFRLRMSGLESRSRYAQRAYQGNSQTAADLLSTYLQDLKTHNDTYSTSKIEPGPFDKSTREVLNEAYGYEVIRTPAAGEPSTPGPTTRAKAPVDPPQSEPSDWHSTFDQQMREQEAEVRP